MLENAIKIPWVYLMSLPILGFSLRACFRLLAETALSPNKIPTNNIFVKRSCEIEKIKNILHKKYSFKNLINIYKNFNSNLSVHYILAFYNICLNIKKILKKLLENKKNVQCVSNK